MTPQRQHVPNGCAQALFEDARQSCPLFFVLQLRLQRIDVGRKAPFLPQVVPDVLIRRNHVRAVDAKDVGQRGDEAPGLRVAMAVIDGLVRNQAVIVPDRLAVAAPPAAERPARERLARVPLPLPVVQQRARGEPLLQPAKQHAGQLALLRAERRRVPLVAVHVVDRDERRLPAHRQPDVAGRERGVHTLPERVDRLPLLVGVRLGDARRLVDPPHVHLVLERGLALVHGAGNRRGAERLWRRGQRQVTLACQQPRCRIETDPSRARQIHLGPRMQVGEVGRGA